MGASSDGSSGKHATERGQERQGQDGDVVVRCLAISQRTSQRFGQVDPRNRCRFSSETEAFEPVIEGFVSTLHESIGVHHDGVARRR